MDIRPSKWKRKPSGRGKFQSEVGEILSAFFVGDYVLEEFPVAGERLFIDFFMPKTKLAVEVHGRQHYEFVEHFHGDKAAFLATKARDKRKVLWCELNKIKLIIIDYGATEKEILESLTRNS
jgi:hypothetical protein